MRLKSLRLKGFKSFAENTLIEFNKPIVGIVGPNGCGKSNVLDAIRWVMGEQSMKSLRGKAREDVIFNGSETRNEEKAAEVTLTLENVAPENRPEGFEKSDVIAITRRLTRAGRSDYLLNGEIARLKDVKMLFLGTGLGKHSYALIEQGRISEFIQSNPEQRRLLIEEAAGISRYKEQKKQAESKMKQTQHNLDRLSDVMKELGSQRNSLQKQARKAKKHRQLSEEIQDLDLYLSSHKYLELWAKDKQIQLILQDLQGRELNFRNGVKEREERHLGLRNQIKEESSHLQGEREKLQNAVAQIALFKKTREHLEEDLESLGLRQNQLEEEIQSIEGILQHDLAELEKLQNTMTDLDQLEGSEENSLRSKESELEIISARVEQLQQSLTSYQNEVMEVATEQARLKNQLEEISRRTSEAQKMKESLNDQLEVFSQKEEELSEKMEDIQSHLEQCFAQEESTKLELEQITFQQETTKSDFQRTQTALRQIQELIADRKGRLESLSSIQSDYSDLNEASRVLLTGREEGQPFTKAEILGAVADFVEPPAEYEAIVASVLGTQLQYLVVDEPYTALEAIRYLKDEEIGRAGFIPMPTQKKKESIQLPKHPGIVGLLSDLIALQGKSNPLLDHLLGDTLLVKELKHALELRDQVPSHLTLVTESCEFLYANQTMVGGADVQNQAGLGILQRRRQVKELQEEIEELLEKEDYTEDQMIVLEEKIQLLTEKHEMLREKSQQWILQKTGLEKDQQQMISEVNRHKETVQKLENDFENCSIQIKLLQDVHGESSTRLVQIEQRRAELEEQDVSSREQLEQDKTRQTQLSKELTELKVRIAARREKHEAIMQQIEQLQKKQHGLKIRTAEQQKELKRVLELSSEKQQGKEEAVVGLKNLESSIEIDQVELEFHSRKYVEMENTLNQLQAEIEDFRNQLEQSTEQKTTYLLEKRELEVQQKALNHEVIARHGIPIGEALLGNHCKPAPKPNEDKRLKQLSKQLNGLGAVNPFAEKEFDEVDERYTFLKDQVDDLKNTLMSLRSTIKKINNNTKEKFSETFDIIRSHFIELFPKLFGGGEGDLILEDPKDLLNTGVDIAVRPPGKRKQRIALLSGGEKAMTTLALIFSFFLFKPSPFCVLDEVDAPLDDANNMRYNNLLKELSGLSQFVVITHSKLTMEMTDHLYGVTMQEPGVSTVIGVQIGDDFIDLSAA